MYGAGCCRLHRLENLALEPDPKDAAAEIESATVRPSSPPFSLPSLGVSGIAFADSVKLFPGVQ